MMGFPDGWCTDLVSNRDALRLCGNAVVPQAAAAAFRALARRACAR
jgi:site-specific DNA-cytosine methylase